MLPRTLTAVMIVLALVMPAAAGVKVIEAEASSAVGSRETARRIAALEATRRTLELAGDYVSGLAEVRDLGLSREEVTAYAGGLLETEIVRETVQGTAEQTVIAVQARCSIDTDLLLRQIDEAGSCDELRRQLLASQKEYDALIRKRGELAAKLAAGQDPAGNASAAREFDALLAEEEAQREVMRIGASISRRTDPFGLSLQADAFAADELDRALTALDRALSRDRRNTRTHVLRAAVYELKGDRGRAEQLLREANTAYPASPLAHMALGLLLSRQERQEEALKQYLAVERLRPREPRVLFHIGMTYKRLGQCRQASSNLNRFLKATQKARGPVTAALRERSRSTLADCKGMPRGPEGRQQPLRRQR